MINTLEKSTHSADCINHYSLTNFQFSSGTFLFICLALSAVVADAQSYRGEAVPVVARSNPIEFSRLRFLTFVFGREGPMDAPLSTTPVAGREYFVEADVFGIESAASIRFQVVDAGSRTLQTLTMWKASDSSDDGEFYGFVTVPNQPFRVSVSGSDTSGAAFRSVFATLFQPSATGPQEQLQSVLAAYRQQLKARAAQAATEHPDGVMTLARAVVSPINYEPFNSASGAPIGVRLRYSIQFRSTQTIVAVPHVFPVYQAPAWRGVVAMKPLNGTITPAPKLAGVQSLQDVIVYTGAATYQGGATYTFTVDMVPDYVFQGTQTGRFCIYSQRVTNRAVWDALMASQAAVPYSISISDTGTFASIPSFFAQRTLYESFAAAGAFDCGLAPNIRF
jgi:hypothetical protein